MLEVIQLVLAIVVATVRGQRLVVENLLLRQQIQVVGRSRPRPGLRAGIRSSGFLSGACNGTLPASRRRPAPRFRPSRLTPSDLCRPTPPAQAWLRADPGWSAASLNRAKTAWPVALKGGSHLTP